MPAADTRQNWSIPSTRQESSSLREIPAHGPPQRPFLLTRHLSPEPPTFCAGLNKVWTTGLQALMSCLHPRANFAFVAASCCRRMAPLVISSSLGDREPPIGRVMAPSLSWSHRCNLVSPIPSRSQPLLSPRLRLAQLAASHFCLRPASLPPPAADAVPATSRGWLWRLGLYHAAAR